MNQMQPMTSKELDYTLDAICNEEILLKQCAVAASQTQNQGFQQLLRQMVGEHKQHLQTLVQLIQSHQTVAPMGGQA